MSDQKTKVLIVDDEDSLRILLRAVITSQADFILDEAEDGDIALAKINQDKPDIMILDVMMPGKTGFEVCELIKENPSLKDITIIILTAKGQDSDRDWAKSCGADYFLRKPFSPLELIDILNKIKTPTKA